MSPALQPVSFFLELAGTLQIFSTRLSKNGPMVTSTHFYLVKRLARKMWRLCVLVFAHDLGFRGGNCNGLLANAGLFFPLVTNTFSSFNANDSLSTLYHGSRFNSPMLGVKVSYTEFLIFSSFHNGFQLVIVRNRRLLMNLHVVQF